MPNAPNPFLVCACVARMCTCVNTVFPPVIQLVLSPCFEAQVTMATGDCLRFTLEVISAQFLILPQQPATLLPVSGHLVCVLVLF